MKEKRERNKEAGNGRGIFRKGDKKREVKNKEDGGKQKRKRRRGGGSKEGGKENKLQIKDLNYT